jgi:hypothetical protein
MYWDGRGFEFSSSLTRPDTTRSKHCIVTPVSER